MQINHLCYMCYLPMPFSKRARFVLANDGRQGLPPSVAYGIDCEKDAALRRREEPPARALAPQQTPRDGMHTILEARGRGHYVGNFLQVYTRYSGWWGEGDTIFHVDGKAMTHTPGTEDEYGSCWGFGGTYSSVSTAATWRTATGQNRMYRWYLANPVRFQQSLKVEIQNQR